MKFLRKLFRFFLSTLFIFIFLLFLGLTAVRFRLLNENYWNSALEQADIYAVLEGKFQDTISQMLTEMNSQELIQVRQAYDSGQLTEEERKEAGKLFTMIDAIESLEDTLGAKEIQNLIEQNISRIVGFLNGKTDKLALYVPLSELGLPPALLANPPLSLMSSDTDVEILISGLSSPDEAAKAVEQLAKIQGIVKLLPVVLIGLFVLSTLLLVGHHFLGIGKLKQIRGTGGLLFISGLSAVGIGIGAVQAFIFAMNNAEQEISPMLLSVLVNIVEGFFSLGRNVGILVTVVGVGIIGWTIYAVKKDILKKEVSS